MRCVSGLRLVKKHLAHLTSVLASLILLSVLTSKAIAACSLPSTDPIHLPLTIVQSNPITTITVGERSVQVIVDTGGGEYSSRASRSARCITSIAREGRGIPHHAAWAFGV
jgi:hypothetical protein